MACHIYASAALIMYVILERSKKLYDGMDEKGIEFCFLFSLRQKVGSLLWSHLLEAWKERSGRRQSQWIGIVADNGSSCQYS